MANRTQALWIVIIVLSVSCAVLLSVVIKSTYFKDSKNGTEEYGETVMENTHPTATSDTLEPKGNEPWHHFRLNPDVYPVHYDLLIAPDVRAEVFEGQVNITLNLTAGTDTLLVHKYKTLEVTESAVKSISRDGNQEISVLVKRSFEYEPNEFWVVQPGSILTPDMTHVLQLKFKGSLTGGIVGLYKSTYTNRKLNKTSAIVSSKFQPTFARRAFPCFDEPNWKSTFSVTLLHDPDVVALSNMPVEVSMLIEDGKKMTKFVKSVPMVSYLVCFVMGDYKYLEKFTTKGTRFRVYATPDQIENAQYAIDIGSHILSYFEEYFGIPYPLPKQDMVAIPDFVSGAMEHWGLITYRETNMLYNEQTSSSSNKQRVASVVAHELAHMWFGNLVTMEWWGDLWLNEGFASYIEYKGVMDYEKSWHMPSQFLSFDLHPVMKLDSKISSHPIIQTVRHPDQITEIFDKISYSKGASVLRMLESFMGSEDFRLGIQMYLKEYKFGNAKTEDLWEKLSESSTKNQNISSIMSSWTKQKGFPVLNVKRESSGGFSASQEVFVESRSNSVLGSEKKIWQIPVTFISSESSDSQLYWLNTSGPVKFDWKIKDKSSWIKFNVNQTGYYLVNYELEDWQKLKTLLETNHQALSASDRSNILHDAFKLASSGYIDYDLALDLTKYLIKEEDYVIWSTAYDVFADLLDYLSTSNGFFHLQKYLVHLTTPLVAKLGWNDIGSHLDRKLRSIMLKLSCKSGHQPCLDEASTMFDSWTNGTEVSPNLRTRVYEYGIQQNGFKSWEYMWKRYKNETSAQEKSKLLYGLSRTRISWLLQRFLKMAEDEGNIKRQDYFTVLMYIGNNPNGRPIMWRYLRENWPKLVDRFTLNERYMGKAVRSIIANFKSEFRLAEVKSFFKKYPKAGAGRRGRKQALEEVGRKIAWLKNNEVVVNEWLSNVVKTL